MQRKEGTSSWSALFPCYDRRARPPWQMTEVSTVASKESPAGRLRTVGSSTERAPSRGGACSIGRRSVLRRGEERAPSRGEVGGSENQARCLSAVVARKVAEEEPPSPNCILPQNQNSRNSHRILNNRFYISQDGTTKGMQYQGGTHRRSQEVETRRLTTGKTRHQTPKRRRTGSSP